MVSRGASTFIVGATGQAIFNLAAGTATSPDWIVGQQLGSAGTILLNSSGTLVANTSGSQFNVGGSVASGEFDMNGGTALLHAFNVASFGASSGVTSLVVDGAEPGTITSARAAIISGRAGGSWTGPGLVSSSADANTFGLGFGQASASLARPRSGTLIPEPSRQLSMFSQQAFSSPDGGDEFHERIEITTISLLLSTVAFLLLL